MVAGIFIPDPVSGFFLIPDPDPGVKKAPVPDLQHSSTVNLE